MEKFVLALLLSSGSAAATPAMRAKARVAPDETPWSLVPLASVPRYLERQKPLSGVALPRPLEKNETADLKISFGGVATDWVPVLTASRRLERVDVTLTYEADAIVGVQWSNAQYGEADDDSVLPPVRVRYRWKGATNADLARSVSNAAALLATVVLLFIAVVSHDADDDDDERPDKDDDALATRRTSSRPPSSRMWRPVRVSD